MYVRKTFQEAKENWEETRWLQIVGEEKDAECQEKHPEIILNIEKDSNKKINLMEEECFSSEECREHFKVVSKK